MSMGRICERAVHFLQVINAEGDVRLCCWSRNNVIGSLLEEEMSDILHGERARRFRQALAEGDYGNCDRDNCPYLANGTLGEHLVDMEEEEIPDYPAELHLAYEGVCNYSCTCCTSHQHMSDTRARDYTRNYEILERKIWDILPYVRHIGANGRGELFASRRILNLLSSWHPIAPARDVSVSLETNGSLFDEAHWRQIENLAQYHVSVFLTVMSFDEQIYRHLSGTKLSMERIEDNLRYVKSLREKGDIDYLELATVLQEENFREMPGFARRCIEEFGADRVRIRPIVPGGAYDRNVQWFMDVRNPEHPYHGQYKEVMSHPIFRHPKVLLWSGDIASVLGKHPGERAECVRRGMEWILDRPGFVRRLAERAGDGSPMYLYGIGAMGKLLLRLGGLPVKEIYDKYSGLETWGGMDVKGLSGVAGKSGTMIVTVYGCFEEIRNELHEAGFAGEVLDLYALIGVDSL